MKAPITTFNGWVLAKIISYLSAKEGLTVETANYTDEGIKTVMKDSFGFRYEISVKTLSRINNDFNELDKVARVNGGYYE